MRTATKEKVTTAWLEVSPIRLGDKDPKEDSKEVLMLKEDDHADYEGPSTQQSSLFEASGLLATAVKDISGKHSAKVSVNRFDYRGHHVGGHPFLSATGIESRVQADSAIFEAPQIDLRGSGIASLAVFGQALTLTPRGKLKFQIDRKGKLPARQSIFRTVKFTDQDSAERFFRRMEISVEKKGHRLRFKHRDDLLAEIVLGEFDLVAKGPGRAIDTPHRLQLSMIRMTFDRVAARFAFTSTNSTDQETEEEDVRVSDVVSDTEIL